jgi:hypothetical protein
LTPHPRSDGSFIKCQDANRLDLTHKRAPFEARFDCDAKLYREEHP